MTIRARMEKLERVSAGASKVHVLSIEGDDAETVQDDYGREKIAPKDIVVLVRKGLGNAMIDE